MFGIGHNANVIIFRNKKICFFTATISVSIKHASNSKFDILTKL